MANKAMNTDLATRHARHQAGYCRRWEQERSHSARNTILLIGLLSILAHHAFANVTTPFESAMLQAHKITKVRVAEVAGDKVTVNIEKTYKGESKSTQLTLAANYYLKKAKVGDTCFLLLGEDDGIYTTKYACGEHSVLILRKDKVRYGIYNYAKSTDPEATHAYDYDKNDPNYTTSEQIENGIIKNISKSKEGVPKKADAGDG